jgi:uncharacterized protein YgiM (DUF1202 family)
MALRAFLIHYPMAPRSGSAALNIRRELLSMTAARQDLARTTLSANALLAEQASTSVEPITSADGADPQPSPPILLSKRSEGRSANTAAVNRNTGDDAVELALPVPIKPQGEAASPSLPSRERGQRIGFGVRLARLLTPAVTGLVILTIAPTATCADELVRVTAERLKLRDRASTSASVVGEFDRGTLLTVLDRDGQWIKAKAPDGRSGWLDTESAAGGAVSAERHTGDEAGVAVASPGAEPLTTADAPVQPPEDVAVAAPLASARDTEDIGERAVTADRQAGAGADRGAAEPKAEPLTATAEVPVQAPEEGVAETPPVSAIDTEGAVEDATTTELQPRDVASRGAAEPKAEPTETLTMAPSADELVRVTTERLNMRDRPGTDAAVVGALDRGTQLKVVERDGQWIKAQAPDGRSGWLSARFLEKPSDGAAGGAVEPVSSAAAALSAIASQVPRRN